VPSGSLRRSGTDRTICTVGDYASRSDTWLSGALQRSLFVSSGSFWAGSGASEWTPRLPGRVEGRSVDFGFGSDLSEEPAVQDVEPVTLDFVSFLGVLPGPLVSAGRAALGVEVEVSVDPVRDSPFEGPDRILG